MFRLLRNLTTQLHPNFPPTLKKKKVISKTTSSNCTLMADSVQWTSQSDYSICIIIIVEFYQLLLVFIMRVIPVGKIIINEQLFWYSNIHFYNWDNYNYATSWQLRSVVSTAITIIVYRTQSHPITAWWKNLLWKICH